MEQRTVYSNVAHGLYFSSNFKAFMDKQDAVHMIGRHTEWGAGDYGIWQIDGTLLTYQCFEGGATFDRAVVELIGEPSRVSRMESIIKEAASGR
jgi:hypothetical protein